MHGVEIDHPSNPLNDKHGRQGQSQCEGRRTQTALGERNRVDPKAETSS